MIARMMELELKNQWLNEQYVDAQIDADFLAEALANK